MIQDNLTFPEYLRSTDFKTFEGLMKIMFGSIKKDIDYIPKLKDYENCPEHMLPILAYSIGCPYFSNTTVYVNRLILKNWWWMMKNKGTLPAIEMATSLALLAFNKVKDIKDIDIFARSIDVLIEETSGIIYIRCLYQSPDEELENGMTQRDWIMELLPYVVPAGFRIEAMPSEFSKIFLEATTEHIVRVLKFKYSPLNQSGVGLKILSDDTTNFRDIYSSIEGLLTPNGVQCPNGLTFGEYDPKETYDGGTKTCGNNCPYKEACEVFTILGVGQQELSAISSYGSNIQYPEGHTITEKNDYIIERADNIYTTFVQNTIIDGVTYSDFLVDDSYSIPYNNILNWYEGEAVLDTASFTNLEGTNSTIGRHTWENLFIGNTYHVTGSGTLRYENNTVRLFTINTDILLDASTVDIPFNSPVPINIIDIRIRMAGLTPGLVIRYEDTTKQHYLDITVSFYNVSKKPEYIYTFSLNDSWNPDFYNGLSFNVIEDQGNYIIRIPRSSTYFNNITFNENDKVIFSATPRNFK